VTATLEEEPGEHARLGFGRRVRFSPGISMQDMPQYSDMIFIKDAATSGAHGPMCYVGFKVCLRDIQPVRPTRVAKPKRSAESSPLAPLQSSAPSHAAATPVASVASLASVTAPAERIPNDALFVRAVVITEQDMKTCEDRATKAEQTPRSTVLAKIGKLMRLIEPISKSPLAIVAPSRVLRSIGANCLALCCGGLQHIAVPVDTCPINIDAAAAAITARVRELPCLNPAANPSLSVLLAFAYTGDRLYCNLDGKLIMPAPTTDGCPYAMLNYDYLKAEPSVEPTLAQFAASLAYQNYNIPVHVPWEPEPPHWNWQHE
jgi:hypothetical protein